MITPIKNNYKEDIDTQTDPNNYVYDAIGNLIEDKAEGITNIETIEVLRVNPFKDFGSPIEIISNFGSKEKYLQAVKDLETELYKIA
jgi:type I site-specific restriction endonuclease